MKLPNADAVYIDLEKLRDYSLNPTHSRGKHKARLFAAILGLTSGHVEALQTFILRALQQYDAVLGMADEYGQRYVVDFSITRNQNTAMVRTAWIIRPDETFPRLVSCYILR